jgi:hypothetical protein
LTRNCDKKGYDHKFITGALQECWKLGKLQDVVYFVAKTEALDKYQKLENLQDVPQFTCEKEQNWNGG